MKTWKDAVDFAERRAGGKPITNRDAAGLILFARAALSILSARNPHNFVVDQLLAWYPSALIALGWRTKGDQFQMSTKWQLAPYGDTRALFAQLEDVAAALDGKAGGTPVPFSLVRSPLGTPAAYKELALDAYHMMQRTDPSAADIHAPLAKDKNGKPVTKPTKVSRAPIVEQQTAASTVVQPPPVVVQHPDGATVQVTPPPVVVPPVVAPPSRGNPAAVPPPGATMPVVVQPPALTVPPLAPGGSPVDVLPPTVVAQAQVVPHPDDAIGAPGDWYWRQQGFDPAANKWTDPLIPRKPKPAPPAPPPPASDSGDSALGLLLVLAAIAFS